MGKKDTVQLSSLAWAIRSQRTPEEVYAELSPHLDAGDPIYVIPLAGPFRARGLRETNQWLVDNLEKNIYRPF